MNKIFASEKRLVDEFGRERIFNGMNVCDKGVYNSSTKKRDYGTLWTKGTAKKMRKAGINLIRLGLIWDAVEPEKGKYNKEYIDFMKGILDECEAAGIYVYLDMHQDLYSGFGDGCGDGAPAWATLTEKYKYKKEKVVWAEGYFFSRAVHKAFDNFWDNKKIDSKGVQDIYAEMWSYLVDELGNHPAVMGYDMMNEPFPGKDGGKVFKKIIGGLVKTTLFDKSISKIKLISMALSNENRPRVLDLYGGEQLRKITKGADELIKNFDIKKYSPFLSNVSSQIRKKDKDKILIMENSYYSNLGIPYSALVPVVNGKADSNVIFAPHAYDFMVDTPSYKYASNERIKAIFDEHKRSQDRLGIPVIVGEWGGYTEGNEWFHHIKFLLELFDKNHWSQTYWTYFDGIIESELFDDVLIRPYPIAVTGKIDEYCHNREENSFTLSYTQDKDFEQLTEIFVPKEISTIETDGEYEISSDILKLKTGIGNHSIKIIFK